MLKYLPISILLLIFAACSSSDEPVRQPDDILGNWAIDENTVYQFSTNNESRILTIYDQDNKTIGRWGNLNVFYYEPGYNLVIYLTAQYEANVYKLVEFNSSQFTWCWVDKIEDADSDSIGKIIGDIINKAQAGYHLNPELYETFTKIPEDKFLSFMESLDEILWPWDEY